MEGSNGSMRRERLNRARVLAAAVALADQEGLAALSMRRLADDLGVVAMALYKHVANKDELLDGMVEAIVGEIDPPAAGVGWRDEARLRVLSARRVLRRHPWARQVLESRIRQTPAVLRYMDSFIGSFLRGGFSIDLTHHAMHALGSRIWGFTQELFDAPVGQTEPAAAMPPEAMAALLQQMSQAYPNVARVALVSQHEPESVVGHGCDDQFEFEFEFALDLLLDGLERLHKTGWTSRQAKLDLGRSAPKPA